MVLLPFLFLFLVPFLFPGLGRGYCPRIEKNKDSIVPLVVQAEVEVSLLTCRWNGGCEWDSIVLYLYRCLYRLFCYLYLSGSRCMDNKYPVGDIALEE